MGRGARAAQGHLGAAAAAEACLPAQRVAALLDLWEAGRIAPKVTEVYPFDQAPAAIARLESRQAIGKIVVTVAD